MHQRFLLCLIDVKVSISDCPSHVTLHIRIEDILQAYKKLKILFSRFSQSLYICITAKLTRVLGKLFNVQFAQNWPVYNVPLTIKIIN